MIRIVNCGIGNLRSVLNAFDAIGFEASLAIKPEDLKDASGIVLPGVGAFAASMSRLERAGLLEALHSAVRHDGKPFLGICLGMQLLAQMGYENGESAGLGWIDGDVRRLDLGDGVRLPHIGWNDVSLRTSSRLFRGIPEQEAFYFVHSYAVRPTDSAAIAATCCYGETFVAAIESDNLFGTQFHPEKSHKPGLAILRNWADVTRTC